MRPYEKGFIANITMSKPDSIILRLLRWVQKWMVHTIVVPHDPFADLNFDQALNTIGSKVRESIDATSAVVVGTFAKINTMFITIQEIIRSAVFELFRFIQDILSLCDPCKLVEAIANPSTLPEIPSLGGLLD